MHNAAIKLINSEHWRDGNMDDKLRDEQWVARFLAESNIPRPASRNELPRMHELRALLRKIAEQLAAKQTLSERALAQLNSFLEPLTLQDSVVHSEDGNFTRKSVVASQPSPAAAIAREFLKLLVDEDWRRLKICANDSCRWVFYDESRNRIRIWCDSARCGNVMKVRRFRARNRS